MRICFYTETALPKVGGQEMVVDALARQFLDLGHEITVLTQQPRWRYRKSMNDAALPYPVVRHLRFFSTRWLVDSYRYFLRRRLRQAQPAFDVLHCHGLYPSGYLAALLKAELAVPLLLTSHGGDVYEDGVRLRKPVLRARHERAVQAADRLIAVSDFTRAGFLRLGAAAERIVAIPNGVQLAEFAEPAARPADLDERVVPNKYVLFIGRLAHRKGVDVLLRALALTRGAVPLVVTGGGVERAALERLAHELGVAPRIIFTGPAYGASKAYLLQNALCTIVPSRMSEAFGLVVLESYAAGTPVIAARHAGLASLVHEQQTGWLVDPEAPEQLAQTLSTALAQRAHLEVMGEKARHFVQDFSWRTIAQRHLDLYRDLRGTLPLRRVA